ncbi:sulfate/molybdate ABC transporter ATP-binding protein [Demequina lignilytica]|uniref:ATP-binding cassette domain-containing protein n=1 Tax=Demequina lignilytica TaxID=3051663 RepID=A0AB35MF79_9MICO|nr:ATP-binding cassette domain-containing protein [Demequina sp. SYSU T0a273]MDN4482402.1 ATP-binding cassette domain-containing protein [Demequina sp. SYSU T0a273]
MTGLDARVAVASRGVDVRLAVAAGRTLVLLGPNGSGKSTLLEGIAGILPGAVGEVRLDGAALGEARTRGVGLLSQDDALFPTMSVLGNVAFGPRARGAGRAAAHAVARRWLDRVGLAGLEDRRPDALSGGQARRVAIARALAAEPRVLLLDEPFAGLDVPAASGIRALLAELLRGRTTVIATHEVLDAYAFADDVAVMDAGRVVEHGTADEVLTRPRTPFAARMAARVLLTGEMRGGTLTLAGGIRLPVAGGPGAGAAAAVAVRPSQVVVGRGADPRLTWVDDAVVTVEPRGDELRVTGRVAAADVDVSRAAELVVGGPVRFGLPHGLDAYPLTAPAPRTPGDGNPDETPAS